MGAQLAFPQPSLRPAAVLRPVIGVRARPWATSLALFAADVLAIFAARAATVLLWNWFRPAIGLANFLGFWQSLVLFAATYAALGLYTSGAFGAVEELRRAVAGATFVCLVLTASLFFLQHTGAYSRGLLILSGCFTAAAVPLVRSLVRHIFARQPWWGVPVIVLGAGDGAETLIERLRRHPGMGLRPVACWMMPKALAENAPEFPWPALSPWRTRLPEHSMFTTPWWRCRKSLAKTCCGCSMIGELSFAT